MNKLVLRKFVFFSLLTFSFGSYAATLTDIAQAALLHDATLAAAYAQRQAEQEVVPQARSALLPSLTAQYNNQDVDRKTTGQNFFGFTQTTKSDYRSKNTTLSLRQPLFDLPGVFQYKSAKAQDASSERRLNGAEQNLLLKVAQATLEYLTAVEEAVLLDKQVSANSVLEKQAQALYEQGDGTIMDVRQAEAKRLLVEADRLQAQATVMQKRREVNLLTGTSDMLPGSVKFTVDDLPVTTDTVEHIIEQAQSQNLAVREQMAGAEALKQNVRSAQAEYLPTLDLVALQREQTNTDLGDKKDDISYVGIEATWNLYQGGRTSSQKRQQSARLLQANDELLAAQREAGLQAEEKFWAVSSLRQRVLALSSAVEASIKAEEAARTGLQVGYRTTLEVLDAEVQHYTSARDLVHARHLLLFSQLELEAAKGDLTLDDLAVIDHWMSPSP